MYIYKMGKIAELRLDISVDNTGEDAHKALLHIVLPDNLRYINVLSKDVRVDFHFC